MIKQVGSGEARRLIEAALKRPADSRKVLG
jgi:hypothetical protein